MSEKNMFDGFDLKGIDTNEPELRDLTCEEIKNGTRAILRAIEKSYARNWIHSEEHHLQEPEPIFDSEEFADDMTGILFEGDTGDFFISVLSGFQIPIKTNQIDEG